MQLGVALTGHWLSLQSVCRLAERAERCGFDRLFVDGDVADVPARDDAWLYDPGALQAAVLGRTRALRVGAIRLPGFQPAPLLARGLAALQALSGGRALAFLGVGSGRGAGALGLPERRAGERVTALEELLEVLRPLLGGARVTRRGRTLELEGARSAPCEPVPPIVVAAAGPRALGVVGRHADVWDANLPPLPECVADARRRLPRALPTWIWVFARPGATPASAARAYRHFCPWFSQLSDAEARRAVLCGEPRAWRAQLEERARLLDAQGLVLDLIGLNETEATRAIEGLAPAAGAQMS